MNRRNFVDSFIRAAISLSGVTAIFIYLTLAIISWRVYPLTFTPQNNWLSDLGNSLISPVGSLYYRLSGVIAGYLLFFFFVFLSYGITPGKAKSFFFNRLAGFFGALASIFFILTGVVPINDLMLHSLFSAVMFASFGISLGLYGVSWLHNSNVPKPLSYYAIVCSIIVGVSSFFNQTFWLEWVSASVILGFVLIVNILSLKNRGKYFHFKKTFLFKHLVFIILASFLFFSLVFYFQSGAWRKYTSQGFVAESEIASNFDSYLRENEFSGAALIVKNGQLLLNKGYGFSNRTVGSKITPETKFPIGSISKQFTAAAILILESQGKLKLEDSICQHLSDCPKDWNGIAIFHLLTNSSGLGDYLFDKTFIPLPWCNISQSDLNRAYEKGKQQSLLFTPGMKFSYSNVGYHLLGDIIENTSGQNYESFLKENIFSKLELTQTGVGEKDLETVGYINKYLKACNFAFSGFKGEGSLFTTTGDFLKWLSIFKSENLLSREVILKMIKPYYPADPEVTREQNMGYGLGVGIIKLYGKNLLTHGGFFSGYKALYEYSPDSDTVLILLTNDQSTDLKIFQDKIAGDIFNN